MKGEEATSFRGLVARGVYLSHDRSEISFAVKELARRMSSPRRHDWIGMKRLARYLMDKTRSVTMYGYQNHTKGVEIWVDSDWAGCQETRKSTSGGVVMHGSHLIKH